MDFAEPLEIEREHLTIEPLRFGQLPFLVEEDRQIVHRRRGVEVIAAEQLEPHVQAAAGRDDRGRRIAAASERRLQLFEIAGDLCVFGPVEALVQHERLPQQLLRLVVLAAAAHDAGQIAHAGAHRRVVRAMGRAPHLQRLAVQPFRVVGAAAILRQPRQLAGHVGDLAARAARGRRAKRQGAIEQRLRAMVLAQLARDAAQQEHHLGLDLGLIRQLGFDARRAALERARAR